MSPQQQQKPSPKDNKMDMSIKIDLDTKNEIVNVTSRLNTDDLDIHAMVEKVVNNSKKMDSIKIDGESYAYLKESISSGTIIVLISKSFQQDVLGNLLKIFLGVGSLSLIVLFIISIYFTLNKGQRQFWLWPLIYYLEKFIFHRKLYRSFKSSRNTYFED